MSVADLRGFGISHVVDLAEAKKAATAVSAAHNADVFLYNGTITRQNVLSVMEEIQKAKAHSCLFLTMITYGGDPHAAFKISRYIQDKYEKFTLFVPGFCKSAGTLFAIAAHELVFAPFGELGPLDVQMAKPDHFQYDSGLVIGESLDTLERRAAETFKRSFVDIISEQQGLISVNSALHAASEITKAIYNPILARVDPDEVGVRQRALRIALDYGERLAIKSQIADKRTVRLLAEKYSSHGFVIDKQEASTLFRRGAVRSASQEEMNLVYALGMTGRIEGPRNQPPMFMVLREDVDQGGDNARSGEHSHGAANGRGDSPADDGDPGRPDVPPIAAPGKQGRRGRRGVRTRAAANGGSAPQVQ